MEIFGFDVFSLVANPIGWIPAFVAGAVLIVIGATLLDEASTFLSNGLTWIRHEFIAKVPIKAVRDWMLTEQLKSVEKTAKIWADLAEQIRKELK